MIGYVFGTESGWVGLVLRVTLALVMFPHGAQKLLGWFGGYGYEGTMGYFTGQLGMPAALAFTVIFIESFGSLGLAAGFGGRLAALGVAAVMIGAVVMSHWRVGFFMNWSGSLKGEGFEYHLLVLAICAVLVVAGSGRWSIDRLIAARFAS